MITKVSNLQQTQIAQVRNQQKENHAIQNESIPFGNIHIKSKNYSHMRDKVVTNVQNIVTSKPSRKMTKKIEMESDTMKAVMKSIVNKVRRLGKQKRGSTNNINSVYFTRNRANIEEYLNDIKAYETTLVQVNKNRIFIHNAIDTGNPKTSSREQYTITKNATNGKDFDSWVTKYNNAKKSVEPKSV